ncbi:MAG: hypothetical protein AB7O52_15905 [Planctomycetota bacterium]
MTPWPVAAAFLGFLLHGTVTAQGTAPVPPENTCAVRAAKIIEANRALPEDIRALRGDELTAVQALVDEAIVDGKAVLRDCPTIADRNRVLFSLARLMVLNNQRALTDETLSYEKTGQKATLEWSIASRNRYFDGILALLGSTTATEGEPDLAGDIDRLRAQCHWFKGAYTEAAQSYRKCIDQHPTDPNPDQTLCALVSSLLKEGNTLDRDSKSSKAAYEKTVEQCDKFVERYPRSDLLPHILHMKSKALIGTGHIQQALEHFQKYDALHREVVAGEPVRLGARPHVFSTSARSDFELYLDQGDFYIGFLNYVLGNIEETKKYYRRTIDQLQAKKERNQLRPASGVFLNRTIEELDVVERLQGQPAPTLDLGAGWLDEPLSLANERGNVVVIYFASFENPRYEPFAKILESYYQKNWHDGFRAVWVTWPKGRNDLPDQRTKFRNQRQGIGVTFPAGFDMSDDYTGSRAFKASVGGGSLVAIDRAGRVAWYKIDPTERDLQLATHVFDRLRAADRK